MIKPVFVSAPGKLVLSGEYAVLEGAPAVVAAVDVRAEVRVEPAEQFALRVINTDEQFSFEVDQNGELIWHQNPGSFAGLLEAAFPILTDSLAELEPFEVSIDTRDFYETSEAGELNKIGVGSSAAVAVCLTTVFQLLAGEAPALTRALEVHADYQGQQGSGIDVVSSWLGGLVCKTDNQIEPMSWPEGLHVLAVSTGIAASTTDRLNKLNVFREAEPETCKNCFALLTDAAVKAAQALRGDSATETLAALKAYASELKNFDDAIGLDIWSAPHRELADIASRYDVVYKPSGAGGGDFGVAFTSDDAALTAFATELAAAGYQIARFGWSEKGIRAGGS